MSNTALRQELERLFAQQQSQQAALPGLEAAGDPAGTAPRGRPLPEGWPEARRQAFLDLPPEVQEAVIQWGDARLGPVRQELEAVRPLGQMGQAFSRALGPYQWLFAREGVDPIRGVESLMQKAAILHDGPPQQRAQVLAELARAHGVDPAELARPAIRGQAQDPQTQEMRQALLTLNRQVEELKQAEVTRGREAMLGILERFLQQTDPEGKPRHPHFDRVKDRMIRLLSGGAADTMEEAYEMASWSDRELREELVDQAHQQRLDRSRQKAQRARAASGSLDGGPAEKGAMTPAPTLREELERQFALAAAR
ncbi:MAG: hypothetical protein HQL82_09865 [Magnetococcales bacterium]|nr:hypothetical protein [Magnetococcales bacterium]